MYIGKSSVDNDLDIMATEINVVFSIASTLPKWAGGWRIIIKKTPKEIEFRKSIHNIVHFCVVHRSNKNVCNLYGYCNMLRFS
jgi:hypothetical protein